MLNSSHGMENAEDDLDTSSEDLAGSTESYSSSELEGRAAAPKAGNRSLMEPTQGKYPPELRKAVFLESLNMNIKSQDDFLRYIVDSASIECENSDKICFQKKAKLAGKKIKPNDRASLISMLIKGTSDQMEVLLKITQQCQFQFVKFCSPDDMVGLSEISKCKALKKIFDDAYKSQFSCVVLEEVESFIGPDPISPEFSELIFQTLDTLPPPDCKLLIIGIQSKEQYERNWQKAFSVHMLRTHLKLNMTDCLNGYISHGIIKWGDPVRHVLDVGHLLIQQAELSNSPVSVLIEGPPHSGKTALAAKIAKDSHFIPIRVCSPHMTIGYHELQQCKVIRKIFHKDNNSNSKCIFLRNIECLIGYNPVGPQYFKHVFQTLQVLLKELPTSDQKLLVIGTTSRKDVLQEMGLLNAFSTSIHVPNISTGEELLQALQLMGSFTEEERATIAQQVKGKKVCVGIKNLLKYIRFCLQINPEHRIRQFLSLVCEDDEELS